MKKIVIGLVVGLVLLLGACNPLPKETHKVLSNGNEYGVELKVLLEGGGTAILICPSFKGQPVGAHGRECYIDNSMGEE